MKATVCPFALSFSISKEGGEGGGWGGSCSLHCFELGGAAILDFFFDFHSDTSTMKTVFLFILAVMIVSVTSRSTGKGE